MIISFSAREAQQGTLPSCFLQGPETFHKNMDTRCCRNVELRMLGKIAAKKSNGACLIKRTLQKICLPWYNTRSKRVCYIPLKLTVIERSGWVRQKVRSKQSLFYASTRSDVGTKLEYTASGRYWKYYGSYSGFYTLCTSGELYPNP